MKYSAQLIVAVVLAFGAFSLTVYGDFIKLPARGVPEGTEFTIGCGDGKVLIGLRGKMGMFMGKLEGLCRLVSTEGRWLGSTSSTETSGGAGGIYPIVPQSFSIACPEDTAVEGMWGRYDGFVVRITLNCFSQAQLASGYGITRSVSAPLHAGDSTSWDEDRCPNGKPGRGVLGRVSTAGVRSLGLVCHSGTTPNLEVLAAPNEVAAVNLVGPSGPPTTTVTPFVQVQWRDRSTFESGFRLVFSRMEGGTGTTIERPASPGTGVLQAVNVTDLPGGGYLFQVCSKFSQSDSPNLCSLPMVLASIALAPTCSPTITSSVERVGSGLARVRWSHTCTIPTSFIVQVQSGNNAFGTVASTENGTTRDETFNFVVGTSSQVRGCAVFPGQGQTSFCSAPRAFQFN